MSELGALPADILNRGAAAVNGMEWPPAYKADVLTIIAQALMKERERCAAIAERLRDEKEDLLGYEGFSDGCHEVAVAIRSGGE